MYSSEYTRSGRLMIVVSKHHSYIFFQRSCRQKTYSLAATGNGGLLVEAAPLAATAGVTLTAAFSDVPTKNFPQASLTVEEKEKKNTIGGDPKIQVPKVGKVNGGSLEEK